MNIFNVNKRKTMSFEDWMKARTVAETGEQIEKGASEITADSGILTPEEGKEGYENAMDDDNVGLDKVKHVATKATYDGPIAGNEGFESPIVKKQEDK